MNDGRRHSIVTQALITCSGIYFDLAEKEQPSGRGATIQDIALAIKEKMVIHSVCLR